MASDLSSERLAQMRADIAVASRAVRSASWPVEMGQRMEDLADRLPADFDALLADRQKLAKEVERLTKERDEALVGIEANVVLKNEVGYACDRLERERDDLRWLIGHLAHEVPDGTMLPPRLAPVVHDCISEHDPGRYTLAPVRPTEKGSE